ncbi:MAG: recombinase RecT, partial [Promethearchaeota archaeon]
KRALINIMSDDKLSKLASTQLGAAAIWRCVAQAALMGLQIGGSIPQAYILGFGNECSLSPTAEGYKFIALSNPDPVLKSFEIDIFYENDDFQMDKSARTIKHIPYITDKKRRLMGIYCMIEELGGNKRVDFITRGEIEEIRDKWSKKDKNGNYSKAWRNSFEMMALAKAAKRFLKPYAALKEGLKMAYDTEDEIKEESRNIEDRAVNIIDVAMPETEPEEPTENKKAEPENENVNLKDFF